MMAIQLTKRAAEHVRRMLEIHAGSIGLRLGTRKSGCGESIAFGEPA